MGVQLRPTIWRSCRVLANERRIELMRILLSGTSGTIGQIAAIADMSPRLTGQYLRMLQARGLASSERVSRYVMYSAKPNPSIPETKVILRALKRVLVRDQQTADSVIATLTAFTHPRRLEIISILHQGDRTTHELLAESGYSRRALARHLDKLERRKIIRAVSEKPSRWHLVRQRDVLARALVKCCV